ncbi:MAG: redoxin domain-containing protein [Planctomycetales bacterium]
MTDDNIARVGDSAPDMTLPDDSGTQTSLSSLWSKQPLALLFVRHLG